MVLASSHVLALSSIVGDTHLLLEKEDLDNYGRDWTKDFDPAPSAVIRPANTEEVSDILAYCHTQDIAVVPSGGRTGLSGGAVAKAGEVVLTLERLRTLGAVDTVAKTVRVGAGAITESVHRHVESSDLTWPIDFASSGSSQIGGNIATNAGGIRVIRYGMTKAWVKALEVVTMDGRVIELGRGLDKDNSGLDLMSLFFGSEGILGVVTAATLKLCPPPKDSMVALLACSSFESVLNLLDQAQRVRRLPLLAFEFFSEACVSVLCDVRNKKPPLDNPAPCYVILEFEGATGDDFLEDVFEKGLAIDGLLSQSESDKRDFWEYREGISESLAHQGMLHKNDISVAPSKLGAFIKDIENLFAQDYPDFGVYIFGHAGDGNLHLNVMKPESMDRSTFLSRCHETDHAVAKLLQRMGGSISAEHGIGLLKRDFLSYRRSESELELMRAIKKVFDPKGLLNPGKVLG